MTGPARDRRIVSGSREYPVLLGRIPEPPRSIFIRGRLIKRDLLAVAVVGSRTPTPYGRHMARRLAGDLAALGVTIVSGLARGIDTEAHESSLRQRGRTVGILGCGLDVDYPRGSAGLRTRIAASGALISEFEPGTPPLPRNFPSRNRIISGMSLGVIVVEAGRRSGSLITARWALDQGREVMAVPGRADSPMSEGPIALIRDGAAPVCSAGEVLEAMGIEIARGPGPSPHLSSRDPVVAALVPGPRLPEELAVETGLPLSRVLSRLTSLTIEGKVHRDADGSFSLK